METRDSMTRDSILGIIYPDTTPSETQIALIDRLIELQSQKLLSRINTEVVEDLELILQVPAQFNWIIVETVIKRFNRIGTEGMKSETVEGHSISFDTKDELDNYQTYFDKYNNDDTGVERKGRIRYW